MKTPNREFELKLEFTKGDFDRIRENPLLASSQTGESSRKVLRSVYFDTPDHRLHAEGLSLRMRNEGNPGWTQTIKAETGVEAGVSNPIEISDELDSSEADINRISDKHLRQHLRKAIKGTVLKPAFETVVWRTTYQLRRGASLTELALDEGEARANGQRSEIREAELELLSGSPEDLFDVAQALFAKNKVKLSWLTKAERGYQLSEHTLFAGAQPVKAKASGVNRAQTAGEAFAGILRAAGEQFIQNQRAVLETDDPEGAHQLRVGLTRLRSLLRILRRAGAFPMLPQFESDARDLGRSVGQLRDADVLIGDIFAPIASSAAGDPGFRTLRQVLEDYRLSMRETARNSLGQEQWSRLLLSLTLWPHMLENGGGKLDRPVEKIARNAIAKRWRKAVKYGQRIDSLEPAERHEMRKSLKKLRYRIEFFLPLYEQKEARQFVKRLKKLQDVFGYINDVRMAAHLKTICVAQSVQVASTCGAAGYVLGRHEAEVPHVWNNADREWQRLNTAPHFWQ